MLQKSPPFKRQWTQQDNSWLVEVINGEEMEATRNNDEEEDETEDDQVVDASTNKFALLVG